MNLLSMYIEQHEMHTCSDIINLSNLIKSQPAAEMTKAHVIFKGRSSTLCLVNTLIPERFLCSQSWELIDKIQAHFFKCLA